MKAYKYVLAGLMGVCISICFGSFEGKSLTIGDQYRTGGAPYFFATFDAAGYSDWTFYGLSPVHNYSYHEILSGEIGAAIYYNGIASQNESARWLTRQFDFPDWPTYPDGSADDYFQFGGTCRQWNDPNGNPTPLYNTGQSIIYNDQVEVTIDYEVVDLQFRDPNLYLGRSPICFIDEQSGQPRIVYSDRYCFLQTFTFRALQSITDFEFYIFLHAHGADEYAGLVNSTYCALAPSDPLQDYVPYNSVHTVGNFRYDLTQWNGPEFSKANHADYVNVSSTLEPDWIDNDVYRGGHWYYSQGGYYKPLVGTHWNVENRQLNDIDRIYTDEVGGAMGWNMPSLEPNETTSITLAYMFGPAQEATEFLELTKEIVNPQSCYSPEDELTFTISWENKSDQTITDAVLIDYLPDGLYYPVEYSFDPNTFEIISSDPNYDEETHRYTWNIGSIPPYGSDSRTLTVYVNELAEPGMSMKNQVTLTTSVGDISDSYDVPVCCWDESGIIYVNPQANGANIGTNWQDAYTSLHDALARASVGCGSEIWVIQGSYDPGRLAEETFTVPAGVSVYGGFAGTETSRSQRNPKIYKTTLTGAAETERNLTIVTIDGSNVLLDGFTVTEPANYGIYGSGVNFTIENCTIEKSSQYGIRAVNGNVTLKWCYIKNNGRDGILHEGYDSTLNCENCWIMKNLQRGIFCSESTPVIKNSIVSESDLSEAGNAGIRMVNPASIPVLHNNTFAHNRNVGISFVDNGTISDPNGKDCPEVKNCILWLNNNSQQQFTGFGKEHIYYSCIYDPNDPDGEDLTKDAHSNFSTNPQFAYFDPNNVHIAYASPCKNAGDPNGSYTNQVDMDNKERVLGTAVDAGAYEIDCEDISNELDWNADGLVNLYEFNYFSKAWLSHDPNDPAWLNDPNLRDPNLSEGWYDWKYKCNLDATGGSAYSIDIADLIAFIEDSPQIWLWKACWMTEEYLSQMMSANQQPMFVFNTFEQLPATNISEQTLVLSCQTQTSAVSADVIGTEEVQAVSEPIAETEISVEEQIIQLQEAIAFLEQIWQEDPNIQQEIDADEWQQFMDSVSQSLSELQTETVQIE